jgi:hypothetical protein
MPKTTMHTPCLPPDGDGEGEGGGAGLGDAAPGAAALGAAVLGREPADEGGSICPAAVKAGCRCPARAPVGAVGAVGAAATGCTGLRRPVCAGCWLPGRSGTTALCAGGSLGAAELCPCGAVAMMIPAAEAPTATAVAAGTHAVGRARSTLADRASHIRRPTSSATPIGSPARHPARREARIASATAARWCAASRASDT